MREWPPDEPLAQQIPGSVTHEAWLQSRRGPRRLTHLEIPPVGEYEARTRRADGPGVDGGGEPDVVDLDGDHGHPMSMLPVTCR